VLRTVTFREYAADGVREREVQRTAVLELERERGADEARRVLDLAHLDRALDPMQARHRQSRSREPLETVDLVRNSAEPSVPPKQRPDAGVSFDELQTVLLPFGRGRRAALLTKTAL